MEKQIIAVLVTSVVFGILMAFGFIAFNKYRYLNNPHNFIIAKGVILTDRRHDCSFGVLYRTGTKIYTALKDVSGLPISCKNVLMTGKQSGIPY